MNLYRVWLSRPCGCDAGSHVLVTNVTGDGPDGATDAARCFLRSLGALGTALPPLVVMGHPEERPL